MTTKSCLNTRALHTGFSLNMFPHFYLFVVNASDNHVIHVSHVTNIQMTNTVGVLTV